MTVSIVGLKTMVTLVCYILLFTRQILVSQSPSFTCIMIKHVDLYHLYKIS